MLPIIISYLLQVVVVSLTAYGGAQAVSYVNLECDPSNARRNLTIVVLLYMVVLFSAVVLTKFLTKSLFGI